METMHASKALPISSQLLFTAPHMPSARQVVVGDPLKPVLQVPVQLLPRTLPVLQLKVPLASADGASGHTAGNTVQE